MRRQLFWDRKIEQNYLIFFLKKTSSKLKDFVANLKDIFWTFLPNLNQTFLFFNFFVIFERPMKDSFLMKDACYPNRKLAK